MYKTVMRFLHSNIIEKQCFSSVVRRQSSTLPKYIKRIDFGICFDIDGVIARGYVPFPEAKKAYRLLTDHCGVPIIPTCFVTNALSRNVYKAGQLTEWLGIKVDPEQMVQTQGPLEMYLEYHHKTCLVIGQGPLQEIASDLGFSNVYSMDDVSLAYPLLDVADHEKRRAVATSHLEEKEFPNIEVILLLGEPKNWECQLQLLIDLLLTNGKPSSEQERVNYQTIPVISCNLDLQYMHRAKFPRFGNGAFLLCLEALFEKMTGKPLEYSAVVGKPSEVTFRYAEHCLNKLAQKIGISEPLRKMYLIGDNIDVDISGANLYARYVHQMCSSQRDNSGGELEIPSSRILPNSEHLTAQNVREVYGILVKTGVSGHVSDGRSSHRDFKLVGDILEPHIILDNALDAVEYIIQKESQTV